MVSRFLIALVLVLVLTGATGILHAQQWVQLDTPVDTTILALLASDGVLLAGTKGDGVYRTSDQGITWSQVINSEIDGNPVMVKSMAAYGEYLFAASPIGIFRSSDKGMTWTRSSSALEYGGALYIFVIGDRLIAHLVNSDFLQSADSGSTWTLSAMDDMGNPVSALASDGEYLYAGTTNGVHSMGIGSTDNWKKLRAANPQDGLAEMVCWVDIVDGVLLAASSNGMIRWNEVSGWSHSGLNGLWLMDAEKIDGAIIAATKFSGVFISQGDLLTWNAINDGLTELQLTSLAVQDNNILYAATVSGGIWKRSLDGVLGVEADASSRSVSSSLHINPNPATERAILRFTIDKPASVTITIHDALGRIVSQPVVDEMQETGEHRITIETGQLEAGAYHCSVRAGGVEHTVQFVVHH